MKRSFYTQNMSISLAPHLNSSYYTLFRQMSFKAFCESDVHHNVTRTDEDLIRLKSIFRIIIISVSLIGVAGNILNLITLRSPTLRTVPFIYIRALAIFDLVCFGRPFSFQRLLFLGWAECYSDALHITSTSLQ